MSEYDRLKEIQNVIDEANSFEPDVLELDSNKKILIIFKIKDIEYDDVRQATKGVVQKEMERVKKELGLDGNGLSFLIVDESVDVSVLEFNYPSLD